MPYSCFISYRHATGYKGRDYTEKIVEDLKAELEFHVTQEVFRDTERLKGGEHYNEALALALCQSICMVVLYWPTYFSEEHTFCAREFKAMERLEQKRLQLLKDEKEKKNGLIIILALRDFDQIPAEIREKRLCKDFQDYTIKTNMRKDPRFRSEMLEVGRYIAGRCRAFQHAADAFAGCPRFRLPPEGQVLPWLRGVARPGLPLPNRELPR